MYKVGDTVVIDPYLTECERDSNVVYSMLSYCGCKAKIVSKRKSLTDKFMIYHLDVDYESHMWNDWMFVPRITDKLKDFLSKLHNEK